MDYVEVQNISESSHSQYEEKNHLPPSLVQVHNETSVFQSNNANGWFLFH